LWLSFFLTNFFGLSFLPLLVFLVVLGLGCNSSVALLLLPLPLPLPLLLLLVLVVAFVVMAALHDVAVVADDVVSGDPCSARRCCLQEHARFKKQISRKAKKQP
jgi:hypothetical protein